MKYCMVILLLLVVGCGEMTESDHSHDAGNHNHTGPQVLQGSDSKNTSDEQDPALKALEELGAKITRNEQGKVLAVSLGSDAGIAHLAGLADLEIVSLVGPQVTDAGLLSLSGLTNLKHFELYSPQVTNAGMAHLKNLKNLNFLALDTCSKISDAGVVHLTALTKLETLSVIDTKVTDAGVAELKKALPNCEINR